MGRFSRPRPSVARAELEISGSADNVTKTAHFFSPSCHYAAEGGSKALNHHYEGRTFFTFNHPD